MESEQTRTPQNMSDNVDKAARLFAEQETFIRGTIGYFVSDRQEREDIYQELFVYFVRKPIPEDICRLRTWLYRVILDRIRDRKRSQARYQQHLQAYAQQQLKTEMPPQRAVDPDQIDALFALIQEHLSPHEARAIRYKFVHHLTVQQIARSMKVKSTTVSNYLAVGLNKLRALLDKDDT